MLGQMIARKAQAVVKLVDANLCKLDKSTLYPQSDGQTTLEVEYQGLKSAAAVAVKDAAADRPISFQLDEQATIIAES